MYGGYPVSADNWRDQVLGPVRRFAVRWRLIPRTMAWKIKLKRLLFGKLQPIPVELTINQQQCQSTVSINASQPIRDYKVIYAVGYKAA